MDSSSFTSDNVSSSSDQFRISGSNSMENVASESIPIPLRRSIGANDDDDDDDDDDGRLNLEEDHFSVNSDIDDHNELEYSHLNRDEQLKLTIGKYRKQLELLATSDLNESDKNEKKRQLVKKICDLKIKLVKWREEMEFEDALRDRNSNQMAVDDLKDELSDDNPIFFKRAYTLNKTIAGHKLVPSNDIYENEKRLRYIWKNYVKCSSPLSLSPTSSNDLLSNSLPISRLLNLLTSNNLSYLTTTCINWSTNVVISQPTNPMQQLICDQCQKKSTKSLNDYLMDALKFGRIKDSDSIPPPASSASIHLSSSIQPNEIRSSNPYLVCIYCFFTIHYNCLTRNIRKCPKIFFDTLHDDDVFINDFYSRMYNLGPKQQEKQKQKTAEMTGTNHHRITPVNGIIECHQKRMKRIILKICPQIGLASQDFRCAECHVPITPSAKSLLDVRPAKARLCDYSGLYFCDHCHMGDTAIIPARVIHNWDFQPQPVSRSSLQIISYLKNQSFHYDRPVLINLVEINPMLYGLVEELIQIKRLRTELCYIYKYISLCKQPSKPRQWISILCQLGSHFLNEKEINYLSFCDVCDLRILVKNLSELEHLFISHITTCEGCRGKGFYCELCPNKEDVLFPFSPNTAICSVCNAVYHKNCYYRRNRTCPRCNRIKDKTNIQQRSNNDDQIELNNCETPS